MLSGRLEHSLLSLLEKKKSSQVVVNEKHRVALCQVPSTDEQYHTAAANLSIGGGELYPSFGFHFKARITSKNLKSVNKYNKSAL